MNAMKIWKKPATLALLAILGSLYAAQIAACSCGCSSCSKAAEQEPSQAAEQQPP
ncbi:MAG: hypothetical protein GDA55_05795 [Cellvibrionales bacterium]|nr:hypothetical protein [Cellvibrionales bacterium]